MQLAELTSILGIQPALPAGRQPVSEIYQGCGGIQLRSTDENSGYVEEIVRLSERAFLLASDCAAKGNQQERQTLSDTDWVHIQFRVRGGGRETVSRTNVVETPESSCVVVRYPSNSVIERQLDPTSAWRAACLYVCPQELTRLLDVPASRLPTCVSWMALEKQPELHSNVIPLQSTMLLAISDILSCQFRGSTRHAYMRAKSLELLSTVIHALESAAVPTVHPQIKLSSLDFDKLSKARAAMNKDPEGTLTLAQLAHRAGLNRTKLALGFKHVYGTSVQNYWRDLKLHRARELLRHTDASVTEIALSVGFAELPSFTRAFTRKFGIRPRDCRNPG